MDYSKMTCDDLEALRDKYEEKIEQNLDNEDLCKDIQAEIDLIEEELESRDPFADED